MNLNKVLGGVIIVGGIGGISYFLYKKSNSKKEGNSLNKQQNNKKESEIWKPLVDQIARTQNLLAYESYDPTYTSLYLSNGDLKANTCGDLDISVKKLNDSLVSLSGGNIGVIEKAKADTEAKFKKFNCRDKIQVERTKNFVDVQTKYDINAEKSVVSKSFKEERIYILVGGLVVLTGLYLVVKK